MEGFFTYKFSLPVLSGTIISECKIYFLKPILKWIGGGQEFNDVQESKAKIPSSTLSSSCLVCILEKLSR